MLVGLIIHGLFAEIVNKAPSLIISNVNYVKKVVFPLEVLPLPSLFAAIFHSLISVVVQLAEFALFNGYLHWTVIIFPFVIFPLIMLTVGLDIPK